MRNVGVTNISKVARLRRVRGVTVRSFMGQGTQENMTSQHKERLHYPLIESQRVEVTGNEGMDISVKNGRAQGIL